MRGMKAIAGLVAATCAAASAARAQTPLETPTDLHVIGFSSTTAFLAWTDNNSPSQAHRVYRRISGGTFVKVYETPFAGGGYPNNFADGIVTGPLTPGVTYDYYVVAFDPFSPTDESGQSNHVTITAETPYLYVTYPDGSETLTAVTMETITWDTNWPDLNVEIHASIDGGFNWDHEVRDGTTPLAAAGSFDWKVGYDSADAPFITVYPSTCAIRVTGVNTALQDQSDATFTILPEPGNGDKNGCVPGAGGRPLPLAFPVCLCALWLVRRRGLAFARAGA